MRQERGDGNKAAFAGTWAIAEYVERVIVMNEKDNIEKRLEELGRALGDGGSVVDKVMNRIEPARPSHQPTGRGLIIQSFSKLAIAAVLLVFAGFVGRFSAPKVNVEQLQSAMEDSIKADLAGDLTEQWRAELATSYIQLKSELNQQHQKDLNKFAVQTIAASNMSTNQLLTELIQSINAAQAQDRQWVMAALGQIESNRLADTTQFKNGLESLAVLTGNEFERTRQDMVQLLVNRPGPGTVDKE
jgi:hypothetical protein